MGKKSKASKADSAVVASVDEGQQQQQQSSPASSSAPVSASKGKNAPAGGESSGGFLGNFVGKSEFVFQGLILLAIYILAFSVRLFSVVRFESMIHEFDPWFNFRSTKFLVAEGFYAFHNWFDEMTWAPLGRWVGNTVYPGLMWTAAVFYKVLHNVLHAPVDIRNVCVMLSPFMASNTSVVTYLLTKEVHSGAAGIFAAVFIALAPGYISRSVAGSFDNEAVAIFALINTFYMWIKAVKTGSMFWGAAAAVAYFYMVAAWGGYIFIINLIPVHVILVILSGKYSHRLYVAYCSFYLLGTLLSMQISFVSWAPVSSTEHYAAFGTFAFLQIYNIYFYVRSLVPAAQRERFVQVVMYGVFGAVGLLVLLAVSGAIPALTGRLWALLGATSNIAIVKSVSEHQPSPWTTFFFDMHFLPLMSIVGMYKCFQLGTDLSAFLVIYLIFASYFASIMVRLVLVLTPVCCILGGIGASEILTVYFQAIAWNKKCDESVKKGTRTQKPKVTKPIALGIVTGFLVLCYFFVIHCTWVDSTAYSSPSIVLQANSGGQRVIFDDFREAYAWLNHNTAPDAKIMSWWDYGYQITGMGNKTTIVDNNTRNNTHIATVGLAMASSEQRSYEVMSALGVNYALVVFGGRIGYSSDDINKFLWMVRISGGIFPEVVESDYFDSSGQYTVGPTVSSRMSNSLMYKMCYYRYGDSTTYGREPAGYDRVRNTEIGVKNIQFTHMEEAFTSEHWMVRIYRVKNDVDDPGYLDRLDLKRKGHL
jgi:dolichyl-diphosphooligosaccharide--protein glycosyltransferase